MFFFDTFIIITLCYIETITERIVHADKKKNSFYVFISKFGPITVFNIGKLKSLTTYKFIISVLTIHGEGLQSDPVIVTTLKEGSGRISQSKSTLY